MWIEIHSMNLFHSFEILNPSGSELTEVSKLIQAWRPSARCGHEIWIPAWFGLKALKPIPFHPLAWAEVPLPRSGGSIQPGLNRKAKINSFSVLCCFTAPTGQLRAPSDVPPTCEAAIVLLFAHSDASLVTVCAILCHLIDLSPLGTWEQKKPKKDKVWFRLGAVHRQRMQTNTQQLPNAAHALLHYTIKQQKVIQSPQWQRLKHFHLHNSKFFTQMTKLPHF